MKWLDASLFGLYNLIIANSFHAYAKEYFAKFDELAAKKYPERMVGDMPSKLVHASKIGHI